VVTDYSGDPFEYQYPFRSVRLRERRSGLFRARPCSDEPATNS